MSRPGRSTASSASAFLAAGVGVLVAGTVMEVALRVVPVPEVELHRRGPARQEDHRKFFVYDPALGWRGRPGATGSFSGWEFSTQVRLNELGFRDGASSTERSSKRPTLLILGDSITWGFGVEEGERYSDQLAHELARSGINAEVRNLAVNGYDTGQELLIYRKIGRSHCPDVVLVGLYSNDLQENMSAWQGPYAKPYFRLSDGRLELSNVPVPMTSGWGADRSEPESSVTAWMREHLRLYALAAWAREQLRRRVRSDLTAPASDDGHAIGVTASLLKLLASDVQRDGSAFGVVILPDARSASSDGQSPAMAAAAQSGVPHVLDLTPVFRQAFPAGASRLFYRLDGAHWTSQAHALAARHVAEFLREARLLARPPRRCPAGS